MVNFITPPILSELLPAFLAHIPTAFTSPQPPPSLFPILSPILRQRIRLLAPARNSSSSVEETWLALLTWSATAGPKLSAHLATQEFIPHPSSGELEVGETSLKGFHRQDKETIRACAELLELDVEVTYIWIGNDPDGEDDGWKIQDVRLTEDSENQKWYASVGEADQAFYDQSDAYKSPVVPSASFATASQQAPVANESEGEGEDDDYWDMYDRTPARTPMVPQKTDMPSEDSYYARYGDVQPALEPELTSAESSNPITMPLNSQSYSPLSTTTANTASTTPPMVLSSSFLSNKDENTSVTHAPRPISVASSSSSTRNSITKLEESAAVQVQSELGVKQHISSTIKSLYRLSKAAGIQRDEFERMLQTEVAVLAMMDDGDDSQTW
ncbi:uncharacterized protein LAJ45_10914 [Morchella importuna]|uniref:Uncharacterized protein n=1 Tax=Morchella conica CCBAS932 TaxID=1392247 RepID=A0A3N4L549_9PEZI|nr:uncharacterized protein LAJ45_10914 [Morchella importuna]KAH8145134.1 hypothetical protein LAJ45_10914 [Morchella importuna]RPB17686.1 hypothetical protein P167DRAFT_7497 [Morchella conica CCBAS932]